MEVDGALREFPGPQPTPVRRGPLYDFLESDCVSQELERLSTSKEESFQAFEHNFQLSKMKSKDDYKNELYKIGRSSQEIRRYSSWRQI